MKNKYSDEAPLGRYIPANIRRQLRHEVNFGCPICGSPYLKYHHFDPPWSIKKHHDSEGMIALCATHADMADGGVFTKNQLRNLKCNPCLLKPTVKQGGFEWLRNELILEAGGFYINPRVYLRVKGRDLIWFNRDKNNNLLLNLNIEDKNGNSVVLMENNDWILLGGNEKIDDIVAPPRGRSLTVKAKQIGLERIFIEFREYNQESFQEHAQGLNMKLDERVGASVPEGFIADLINNEYNQKIKNSNSEIERKTLKQQNEFIMSPHSRGELFMKDIKWPVTRCKINLHCNYPFPIKISSTMENYDGWKAAHSIGKEINVIWNL